MDFVIAAKISAWIITIISITMWILLIVNILPLRKKCFDIKREMLERFGGQWDMKDERHREMKQMHDSAEENFYKAITFNNLLTLLAIIALVIAYVL